VAQLSLENWQDFDLDENMIPLVLELARLPGIITKSSCGGHTCPGTGTGQRPAGEWYITFMVTWDMAGLVTLLRTLSKQVGIVSTTQAKDIQLEVKWEGMSCPMCFLTGTADPASVAEMLREWR